MKKILSKINKDESYSLKQVAGILECHLSSVMRIINKGELDFVRITCYLVDGSDLYDYVISKYSSKSSK